MPRPVNTFDYYGRVGRFLEYFLHHERVHLGALGSDLSLHRDPALRITEAEVSIFVEWGCVLGLLVSDGDNVSVVANSSHVRTVIRSVFDLVASHKPVLDGFSECNQRAGWVHVLRELEKRRIAIKAGKRQRRAFLSHLIIVGDDGEGKYVLLDLDKDRWRTAKPVGGKSTPSEEPEPLTTLLREVGDNLERSIDSILAVDEKPIETQEPFNDASATTGEWVEYHIKSYSVVAYLGGRFQYDGDRHKDFHWMHVHELVNGLADFPEAFFRRSFPESVRDHIVRHPMRYRMAAADLKRVVTAVEVAALALGRK